MLPELLAGSYEQYKKDTLLVTTWLSKIAISCGYSVQNIGNMDYIDIQDQSIKTKKLKGRERTLERRKAVEQKKIEPQAIDEARRKCIVPVNELLRQAQRVALSSKEVPHSIMRALESALIARKRCIVWFKLNKSDEAESNKNHEHFVEILEKIADLLRPQLAPQRTRAKSKNPRQSVTAQHATTELQNRFSGLKIHQSSCQDENVEDDNVLEIEPTLKHDKLADVSFELEMPDDEGNVFALFCLIKDMLRIREHLSEVWDRFKKQEIGLITAGTITTAAIRLFRDMETALVDDCKILTCQNGNHLEPTFLVLVAMIRQQPGLLSTVFEANDLVAFSTVYATLASFQAKPEESPCEAGCDCPEFLHRPLVISGDVTPVLRLISEMTRAKIPLRKTMNEISDTIVDEHVSLGHQILDFQIVAHTEHDRKAVERFLPIPDPVQQGLRLVQEGAITWWNVLACRVLLDIQEAIGEGVYDIYHDLVHTTANKLRELNLEPCPNAGCSCLRNRDENGFFWLWSKSRCGDETVYRLWHSAKQYGAADPCIFGKLCALKVCGHEGHAPEGYMTYNSDPAYYLKKNVLRTSMIQLSMTLDTEYAGIALEDDFWSVYDVSHLYNLGRRMDLLKKPWKELEQAIDLQQDAIFGSTLPSNAKAAYNCFMRKARVPAKLFANNLRPDKNLRLRLRPEPFVKNPVFELCREHFLEGKISIKQWLHRMCQNKKKSHTACDYSITHLLQECERVLSQEFDRGAHFDYLQLTRKCCKIMVSICNMLDWLDPEIKMSITNEDPQPMRRNTYTLMTGDMLGAVARDVNGGKTTGTNFEHNAGYSTWHPEKLGLEKFKVVLRVIEEAYT